MDREKDLARLAAVQRVLDGGQAVAETLRNALERLEPELDVLRGEVAALAVAQVEARRAMECRCRVDDASWPTYCGACEPPSEDELLVAVAMEPGAIVTPEAVSASERLSQAERRRLLAGPTRLRVVREPETFPDHARRTQPHGGQA